MTTSVQLTLRMFLIPVLLGAATATVAQNTSCERPARLRYSMVPEGEVEKDLARFRPLLNRLGTSLGIPVDVIAPTSYGAVIELLSAGKIDVARLGPASYLAAKRHNPGIVAFATASLNFGLYQEQGAFYQSLLIVRADSRFGSSEDLRGATLALVDPNSTSGGVIPRRTFLKDRGTSLQDYFGRISYSGSHPLAVTMVADGRADAAFVSSLQLSMMATSGALKKSSVRVLWRSSPVPMDPFVYRGNLCNEVKEKIRAAFLQEGNVNAEVLNSMSAARFLSVQDSDYDVLRGSQ